MSLAVSLSVSYHCEHITETLNGEFSTAGTLFNGPGDNDYADFSYPLTRQSLLAITDCPLPWDSKSVLEYRQ